MGYQTVRALTPIRHSGVLRIPGQTSGDNAQDFVAEDTQANRLVALGYATSLGLAAAPVIPGQSGGSLLGAVVATCLANPLDIYMGGEYLNGWGNWTPDSDPLRATISVGGEWTISGQITNNNWNPAGNKRICYTPFGVEPFARASLDSGFAALTPQSRSPILLMDGGATPSNLQIGAELYFEKGTDTPGSSARGSMSVECYAKTAAFSVTAAGVRVRGRSRYIFGSAYQRTSLAGGGFDNISVLFPPAVRTQTALKVLYWFHGAGESNFAHLSHIASGPSATGVSLRPMLAALLADGWTIVANESGNKPIVSGARNPNHWGNPASYLASQAMLTWVRGLGIPIATEAVWGMSMGGTAALRLMRESTGISKFFGTYPVMSVDSMSATGFASDRDGAYTDIAGGYAAVPECDPMQATASQYGGKKFMWTASAADSAVIKATNTDLFLSKYGAAAAQATALPGITGAHGDASNFTQAVIDQMLPFLNS